MAVKTTQAQKDQRVREVYKMLVKGHARGEIVQVLSKKWNVTDRTIDNYIQDAREQLKPIVEEERMVQLNIAVDRMTEVFKEALDSKDHRAAIQAQQELNKLFGLYAPTKQEVSGNIGFTWGEVVGNVDENSAD